MHHVVTTRSTEVSQRRAAFIAPFSPQLGKTCCSRQSESHRAKTIRDQRNGAATIVDEENRRSEGSDL